METTTNMYYDRFAGDFEKIPFGTILTEKFCEYVKKPEGLKVLDIGSGPGSLAAWILQQGCDVTCIDPSEEMAKRCREKKLRVIQKTFSELEELGQFDLIFAISSFIHIPKSDLEQSIQKVTTFLCPGGFFFFTMLLGEGEAWEDPLKKGVKRYFNYETPNRLKEIFGRQALFSVDEEEVEVGKMGKSFGIYVLQKLA